MDDLVTWLRAQLDEDERVARGAIDPKHRGDWAWRKDSRSTVRERDGVPIGPESRGVEIGPHIARWNPARVLREVESKRQILDQHPRELGVAYEACGRCHSEGNIEVLWDGEEETVEHTNTEMPWPCPTVRHLAAVYADRPEYQEEWKP